ncbi:alpha/beta hydrolase [Gorillibacterium sp. sgz5001074]|uniref:alpha/beta hydrolase n=1 Tax=Gorillibacterium sp. sgz5001074 TaxID=3446695 RepID=UPI003F669F7B
MQSLSMPAEQSAAPIESMERKFRTPEPFFLPGFGPNAETVALLIHGFTGSPSEFRRLGYYLHDQGYTVKAVLLPGHGTTPEDMIQTGFRDWWRAVKEAYESLQEAGYRKIIPIGHSMGGLLSLKLAMEEEVAGCVSLATPIHLGSRKVVFAWLLSFFVKYVSKRRPPGAEHITSESLAYDRTPLKCVVHFRRLLFHVKKKLNRVRVPLFIGQGELDKASLPHSAPFIYKKVASELKELKVYPNSAHGILLESDREQVYEDIGQFIARLT